MKKRNYRRGIAIEMAIGLMLLVIALSIILLTVSALQIKNQRYDFEAYEKKVLEFAVEDMVAAENPVLPYEIKINEKSYALSSSKSDNDDNDYTITIEVDGTTVYTVTVTDGKISDWK